MNLNGEIHYPWLLTTTMALYYITPEYPKLYTLTGYQPYRVEASTSTTKAMSMSTSDSASMDLSSSEISVNGGNGNVPAMPAIHHELSPNAGSTTSDDFLHVHGGGASYTAPRSGSIPTRRPPVVDSAATGTAGNLAGNRKPVIRTPLKSPNCSPIHTPRGGVKLTQRQLSDIQAKQVKHVTTISSSYNRYLGSVVL